MSIPVSTRRRIAFHFPRGLAHAGNQSSVTHERKNREMGKKRCPHSWHRHTRPSLFSLLPSTTISCMLKLSIFHYHVITPRHHPSPSSLAIIHSHHPWPSGHHPTPSSLAITPRHHPSPTSLAIIPRHHSLTL